MSIPKRLPLLVLILIFLVMLVFRIYSAFVIPASNISNFQQMEATVTGDIEGEPRISEDAAGVIHLRYVLRVREVRIGEEHKRATGKIVAYSKGGERLEEVTAYGRSGDRLEVRGKIKLPHDYQNPGRINFIMSQRSQGITAQMIAEKGSINVIPQEGDWLLRLASDVRYSYRERMEQVMPSQDAAAIFAMLFGGYDGIKEELLESFTLIGIIHILSVSGSHITLLAGTAAIIGRIFHFPAKLTAILATFIIIVYGILAGAILPVIRAACMGIVTIFAVLYEKEKDSLYVLAVIAFSMLMYSPLLIFDISFQLSFGATAGILCITPVLRRHLMELHLKKYALPSFVAESFAITIGAQLFLIPLLAWYFNVISLTSLIANLAVVPLVDWIIILGLLAGTIGGIIPFAGKVIFIGASLLLGFVYEISKIIAALPGSRIYLPTMEFKSTILYYLLIFAYIQNEYVVRTAHYWIKKYGSACSRYALTVFFIGVIAFACNHAMKSDEVQVHFIDCGQGDSCLVITPHGHAFMVDTGGIRDSSYDIGKRVDVPYLLHYGITKLDCIFLTHAHADHAGGVAGIVEKMPVGAVFIGHEGTEAYMNEFGNRKPVVRNELLSVLQDGSIMEIDGVKIEVLYSPTADNAISTGNATGNEFSNLFRISYGNASFLITGDLVKEQEKVLIDNGKNVKATVLKVGHHGSHTSNSPEWLRAVTPRWCVISCGYENSFGHPHEDVLTALRENTSAEVLRTDLQGAIIFRTDGTKMKVETFGG